jgi:hypothetical protein
MIELPTHDKEHQCIPGYQDFHVIHTNAGWVLIFSSKDVQVYDYISYCPWCGTQL